MDKEKISSSLIFSLFSLTKINQMDKRKIEEGNMNLFSQIKKYRKILNKTISKTGIYSDETKNISNQIDRLIVQYYQQTKAITFPTESSTNQFFEKSYQALKIVTINNNKFPTVTEWNEFAKKNNCLCHKSLEYITRLDWNYLEIKVQRELNFELN